MKLFLIAILAACTSTSCIQLDNLGVAQSGEDENEIERSSERRFNPDPDETYSDGTYVGNDINTIE